MHSLFAVLNAVTSPFFVRVIHPAITFCTSGIQNGFGSEVRSWTIGIWLEFVWWLKAIVGHGKKLPFDLFWPFRIPVFSWMCGPFCRNVVDRSLNHPQLVDTIPKWQAYYRVYHMNAVPFILNTLFFDVSSPGEGITPYRLARHHFWGVAWL